jgi:hypothetical protein
MVEPAKPDLFLVTQLTPVSIRRSRLQIGNRNPEHSINRFQPRTKQLNWRLMSTGIPPVPCPYLRLVVAAQLI